MLKIIFFLNVVLIAAPFCFGQKYKQLKYVVKQSLPSVYITYIKTDEQIIFDDVKEKFAWFRLHNNSKKKIAFKANGGFGENDATLFYDLLDINNKIIESTYCHVCSTNLLASGNNILFSIPTKDLKNSDSMRVAYSYEWEEPPFSKTPEKEPVHYVYFETPRILR